MTATQLALQLRLTWAWRGVGALRKQGDTKRLHYVCAPCFPPNGDPSGSLRSPGTGEALSERVPWHELFAECMEAQSPAYIFLVAHGRGTSFGILDHSSVGT